MVRPPRSRYEAIHKFDIRSVCCTFFCISLDLCIRFFLLQSRFFRNEPPKLDRRKAFSNRATAAMFAAIVINFLLTSLRVYIKTVGCEIFFQSYSVGFFSVEKLFGGIL